MLKITKHMFEEMMEMIDKYGEARFEEGTRQFPDFPEISSNDVREDLVCIFKKHIKNIDRTIELLEEEAAYCNE